MLTGPSFWNEVAKGLPTAVALASRDGAFARSVAAELHGPRLRLYANDDLVGAEIGGAVKNVMAIAAGINDGLGFGYNARAALMTRGLAEDGSLGGACGGQPATFIEPSVWGIDSDLYWGFVSQPSRWAGIGERAVAEGHAFSLSLVTLRKA